MTEYFKTPYLPDRQAKAVLTDYRLNEQSRKTLESMGIKTYKTKPLKSVYAAIDGHTDIQLFHVGGKEFVCAPETYEYYKEMLMFARLYKGESELGAKYPKDIAYNAAAVGGRLLCAKEYTERHIIEKYDKIINTKQGYAKCSTAIITENAIITADKGIYESIRAQGCDALLIKSGHIELKGMNYGFIGGASGKLSSELFAVNGDLSTHPDSDAIKSFCRNYGIETVSLKSGAIEDVGSIMALY